MARIIRSAQRSIFSLSSPSSKTLIQGLHRNRHSAYIQSGNAISTFPSQSRPHATAVIAQSRFDSNILRVLRNEIDYQSHYAPPHQPVTEFKSFMVEDHPGGLWITMRGTYGDNEHIKMEITMFDGYEHVPKVGEDSIGEDVRLHISLLVDISKGKGCDEMEFVCSVWPNCIEIQKVYMLRRDRVLARPHMGPDYRNLKSGLQKGLHEYLEARGVNDELSVFLHEYMKNKDRIELIQWLRNVKHFLEK